MRTLLEMQPMGRATPGAAPVEDTSFLPLLSSQGQACAELYAADNSEASDEIAERTTVLKSAMHKAGFGEPEIDLSVHIEYYMRELGGAWLEEGRLTGSTEPLATWAMRQLLSVSPLRMTLNSQRWKRKCGPCVVWQGFRTRSQQLN